MQGWAVNIRVKGMTRRVQGDTAAKVFSSAKEMYQINGEPVRDLDLWVNLNVQWISALPEQHRPVELHEMLSATQASPVDPSNSGASDRQHGPHVWGRLGWGMLQMYLAQDIFDFGKFKNLSTELHAWLDPDLNPSIGCAECYRHFARAVDSLHQNPLDTQDQARRWLVEVMNEVNTRLGKPSLPYETAAKLCYWTR